MSPGKPLNLYGPYDRGISFANQAIHFRPPKVVSAMLGDNIDELQKKRNSIDGEELLDNQDLLQMLKISNRSLQRYRSIGKLPYYTISGKLYYKLSDVHQFIRESFNPPTIKMNANK